MARGDYSRRVTATSRDEVGEAARAFNAWRRTWRVSTGERRELVREREPRAAYAHLALQAVLENMVDGVTPTDPATLRTALEQVERLGRLVTSLLDLSRIDAAVDGGVSRRCPRTDVPLEPFLQSAVRGAAMTGRDVAYEVEVSPPELTAFADPERLYQVVANLLDNASRHSPAGVSYESAPGRLARRTDRRPRRGGRASRPQSGTTSSRASPGVAAPPSPTRAPASALPSPAGGRPARRRHRRRRHRAGLFHPRRPAREHQMTETPWGAPPPGARVPAHGPCRPE
jgi:signal transduction histidine kinase